MPNDSKLYCDKCLREGRPQVQDQAATTPETRWGTITIANGEIGVLKQDGGGFSECRFDSVTVENVHDAARILSLWMDIPFANVAAECRRVHEQDQFRAELKEFIDDMSNRVT